MISRRLLRLKTLHILYAWYQSDKSDLHQAEKELYFSIDKFYELYHLIFLLLSDLRHYAWQRLELERSKLFPSNELILVNQKLSENKVLTQISNNLNLNQFVNSNKISWVNYPALIKNLYNTITESEFFKQYLAEGKSKYSIDKKLVEEIIISVFSTSEELFSALEEMSIYWNDDTEFALSMALVTLKGFNQSKGNNVPLLPLFKNDDDREFAGRLLRHVVKNADEYEKMIEPYCKNWDVERIALMDMLLMKIAISEIMEFPTIPVKVTLNEYLDFSKAFSTTKSHIFINGILDRIIAQLKSTNRINKTGRGLLEHNSK